MYREAVLPGGPHHSLPVFPGAGPCPENHTTYGGPIKSHIGPPPSLLLAVKAAWIQGGSTCTPTRPRTMEGFMGPYSCHGTLVQETRDHLT